MKSTIATLYERKRIREILNSTYPDSNWNSSSPFHIERTGAIITIRQQGAILATFGRKAFDGFN